MGQHHLELGGGRGPASSCVTLVLTEVNLPPWFSTFAAGESVAGRGGREGGGKGQDIFGHQQLLSVSVQDPYFKTSR